MIRLESRTQWQCDVGHTCDDLGALKVLIGVEIAGGQGEVEADQDEQEVGSPPHGE